MSKLKCPIHHKTLAYLDDGVFGHTGCGNTGNIQMWKTLIDTQEKLDIALRALDLYALDIQIAHTPQFAYNALLRIRAKDIKAGQTITMPAYTCKKCGATFVSLRGKPTCPMCSNEELIKKQRRIKCI